MSLAKVNAQVDDSDDRPKIGLVLSGGGAKGFAHIGALKVIDSLGIKIDYVAGTSMGAIVGSLYASGYTGNQMDSIISKTDFGQLIIDDIPREARTFYERRNSEKYAVTLPFKDFQIQLPNSLSAGQNFYNLLSQLMAPVGEVDDFEKLPIPFFCMATDVLTGEAVVLDNGYLPKVVNASAALPSLLSPVEINDRLFIDGGVTNNYPIEILRSKGMDIIIGIDVQDDLKTREELGSAFEILAQINNFRTINDMKVKSQLTDIYIKPDITKFTVTSFSESQSIIQEGKIAALKNMQQLKPLVQKNYKRKDLDVPDSKIYIDRITIDGNDKYSRAYILGRFKIKTPGFIDYSDINTGINNLKASNNFTKINYIIKHLPEENVLSIEVSENEVRNYLRLGVHYDNLFKSAAIVNLSRKSVLVGGDIVSGDVILGDNPRYNFDYYIDKGRYWSIGLHSSYINFEENVNAAVVTSLIGAPIPGINSVELEFREFTHQFYVQTQLAKEFNLQIGAELKNQNAFTETLSSINPDGNRSSFVDQSTGSVYGRVLLDSFNKASFADSGWNVTSDFHLYLFEGVTDNTEDSNFEPHSIAQIEVAKAYSIGRLSARGSIGAGVTLGVRDNTAFNFFLGGFGNRRVNNILPFFGYDFLSITGGSMIRTDLEVDYEIFPKNHLIFNANYASVEDDLFQKDDWFSDIQYRGYAIGYGLETFIGPISARYSFTPQGQEGQLFVNLGFRF
ncbi:MAG: patatin-like phospholipase family protein [Nonlabens sp.]